jgi:hypothetical protein
VASLARGADGRIAKVLPQFTDRRGRVALSPSLFDRDAYQAELRLTPAKRSGLRFQVQWTGRRDAELRLKLELRGIHNGKATAQVLEMPVRRKGWGRTWTAVDFVGKDYATFGELLAWRATLWEGESEIAEQKSFLW